MAKSFEELDVWKIGRKLKLEIYRLTKSPSLVRDFKLRGQLEDAAASICSNIAEGFGRRSHPDFARFLTIADGSAKEIENHLIDTVDRRRLQDSDVALAREHLRNLKPALAAFIAYLRRTPTPKFED